MDEELPDYSGFEEQPTGTDLEVLTGLGLQLKDLERQKEEAQSKVKKIEAAMREISWKQIPDLMDKLGVKEFKLSDGSRIVVREDLRVSMPKGEDKRKKIVEWVEKNGGEHLVKRAFEILFGKEEEAWAKKFERDCKQRKKPLNINRSDTVMSNTLKKFLRDKLEAGEDVPLDELGAFRQTIAEFKEK